MNDSKLIQQVINRTKYMTITANLSAPSDSSQVIARNKELMEIIQKQQEQIDFLIADLKNIPFIEIGQVKQELSKDIFKELYFINAKSSILESITHETKDSFTDSLMDYLLSQTDSKTVHTPTNKKSRLSTSLFAGIMGCFIGITLIVVPSPYNIFTSLALCGPLSVSLYGLRK